MSALMDRGLSAEQLADVNAADRAERLRDVAIAERNRQSLLASDAEEHVLSDTDSYVNWLAYLCSGVQVSHTRIVNVPRSAENLLRFVEALDVPQLVALQFYPRSDAQVAACDELRSRYLADQSTQAYVALVQEELA